MAIVCLDKLGLDREELMARARRNLGNAGVEWSSATAFSYVLRGPEDWDRLLDCYMFRLNETDRRYYGPDRYPCLATGIEADDVGMPDAHFAYIGDAITLLALAEDV